MCTAGGMVIAPQFDPFASPGSDIAGLAEQVDRVGREAVSFRGRSFLALPARAGRLGSGAGS